MKVIIVKCLLAVELLKLLGQLISQLSSRSLLNDVRHDLIDVVSN